MKHRNFYGRYRFSGMVSVHKHVHGNPSTPVEQFLKKYLGMSAVFSRFLEYKMTDMRSFTKKIVRMQLFFRFFKRFTL